MGSFLTDSIVCSLIPPHSCRGELLCSLFYLTINFSPLKPWGSYFAPVGKVSKTPFSPCYESERGYKMPRRFLYKISLFYVTPCRSRR